ncbi:MAG: C4-dicarboxylate ABC transporter, partial [Pseudomonadota bacterium]|nr:C4-dicarboxylate ABC transporter [Pseudomonadota bacterium]
LQLTFFTVFGCVLVALLVVMWLIVARRTVQGAWHGELFVSPCLAGLAK